MSSPDMADSARADGARADGARADGPLTLHARSHAGLPPRRAARRARSTSPDVKLRGPLILASALALGWLAVVAWPAPLAVLVGGALFYAVQQLRLALRTALPRRAAMLLTAAAALAVLAALVAVVLGPSPVGAAHVHLAR